VYNSLGIIYRRQGRYDKAADQYQRAIKVNALDENIYYNLGRIYYDTEQLNKARDILVKALEINPSFKEASDMVKAIDLRHKALANNGS
jgi:tetratricopeptide (TPR) repeat protein